MPEEKSHMKTGFVGKCISVAFQESIGPNIVYDFKDEFNTELFYLNAGLNEEAGEVSGKIKKYMRGDYNLEYYSLDIDFIQNVRPDLMVEREDHNKEVNKRRDQIAYELGDCLWYLTRMANLLGYSLEQIMRMNMDKLAARYEANTIRGDGDER